MKSLCAEKYGSFDFLNILNLADTAPNDSQVRVAVRASSLNPADYKVALGEFKFLHGRKFPLPLGYDFSGEISAVGAKVSEFKVGDEVFGFLPYGPFNQQGAFGENLIAKPGEIAIKPKNVSHIQAAAAATSAVTAIQSLRNLGRLRSGGKVVVTGASGGVGSVAVQVAKRLGASEVIAVGSGRGLELASRMGADKVVDRKRQDVLSECIGPFDVIFDAAAAYRWAQWKTKLNNGGAFVTTLPSGAFFVDKLVSLASGSRVEFVNVKSKAEDLRLLAGWLESGFQVPVESTVTLPEVKGALARLKKGEVLGKVAVQV